MRNVMLTDYHKALGVYLESKKCQKALRTNSVIEVQSNEEESKSPDIVNRSRLRVTNSKHDSDFDVANTTPFKMKKDIFS